MGNRSTPRCDLLEHPAFWRLKKATPRFFFFDGFPILCVYLCDMYICICIYEYHICVCVYIYPIIIYILHTMHPLTWSATKRFTANASPAPATASTNVSTVGVCEKLAEKHKFLDAFSFCHVFQNIFWVGYKLYNMLNDLFCLGMFQISFKVSPFSEHRYDKNITRSPPLADHHQAPSTDCLQFLDRVTPTALKEPQTIKPPATEPAPRA